MISSTFVMHFRTIKDDMPTKEKFVPAARRCTFGYPGAAEGRDARAAVVLIVENKELPQPPAVHGRTRVIKCKRDWA